MVTNNFVKIIMQKGRINNTLDAMLKEQNPEKVRKYIQKIANAFKEEYEANKGKNIHSLLDDNINESLFSGAIHTAHAMTCKKQERNIEDVAYWGLGFQSDDANRLARVNYNEPNNFLNAIIAGEEVDRRREWLKENNGLIIINYNEDDTNAIRAQFEDVLKNINNMNINKDELKNMIERAPALLQGLLGSAAWYHGKITPSEKEYTGLGLVHDHHHNTGAQHEFSKNQMQHSLTTFVDAIYNDNAGLSSNFRLRNGLIIPFNQKDEAEYLIQQDRRAKRMEGQEPVDHDSPFNFENKDNIGIRVLGGKKPSLDEYDNIRDRFESDELVPYRGTFGWYPHD